MELAAEGTYERNTVAVKRALLDIRRGKPEAVIMVGAYKPCATFIKLAARAQPRPDLRQHLLRRQRTRSRRNSGRTGQGVVVTPGRAVPGRRLAPGRCALSGGAEGARSAAKPGFVSLEGYLVGRLVAAALEKVEGEPTRKALLEAIVAARSFDLGGVRLVYGADDNRGMAEVFLTVLGPDGAFKPVQTLARAGG